jgi:hypothetical protein
VVEEGLEEFPGPGQEGTGIGGRRKASQVRGALRIRYRDAPWFRTEKVRDSSAAPRIFGILREWGLVER